MPQPYAEKDAEPEIKAAADAAAKAQAVETKALKVVAEAAVSFLRTHSCSACPSSVQERSYERA